MLPTTSPMGGASRRTSPNGQAQPKRASLASTVAQRLTAKGWLPAKDSHTDNEILDAVDRLEAHNDRVRADRVAKAAQDRPYQDIYAPRRAQPGA